DGAMSANAETQNIFLIRHAKPELPNGGGIYYGSTDYPLSQDGEKAAAALNCVLSPIKFAGIYSSDLIRARRTLELALPESAGSAQIVRELREINLGDWEGKTFDEVRTQWDEIYEARGASFDSVSPPGGESFKELSKRTVPAFEKIMESTPNG
ncbi:MAG: histidine phosphatase family protein, partial [Synergistaceae bacterium]